MLNSTQNEIFIQPVYERFGCISDLHLVLECIRNTLIKKALFLGHNCNVQSLRLQTFAKGPLQCCSCGLPASYFALERHSTAVNTPYHLNLYGVDSMGASILFTHDHVMPKSVGGADTILNTQTMCYPCNQTKGHQWDGISGVAGRKKT